MLRDNLFGINRGPVSRLIAEYIAAGEMSGTLKSVTGNPISVSDAKAGKVKALTVGFSPKQDLNGYSNPWPGGGGKNLLPLCDEADTVGITITRNTDGSLAFNGTAESSVAINLLFFDLPAGDYYFSNAGSTATATGSTATVYVRDNDNSETLVSVGVGNTLISGAFTLSETTNIRFYIVIQSGATLSGTLYPMIRKATETDYTFAPYSNICPISGWTSLGLTKAGKNLFDKTTVENGFIEGSSGNVINSSSYRHSDYIRLFDDQTYTISGSGWTHANTGAFYDADKNYISGFRPSSLPNTFTPPANACYMRLSFEPAYVDTAQLELGSTATTYAAPSITPITVALGDTYYSGTVDVVSGEGSSTYGYVDLGTLDWRYNESLMLFYSYIADAKYYSQSKGGPCYCTALKSAYEEASWSGWAAFPDFTVSAGNNFDTGRANITIKYSTLTDTAVFKAAMSGVYLCYELATPTSFSNTPQDITLLKGDNTVWTDADSLTMQYKAST